MMAEAMLTLILGRVCTSRPKRVLRADLNDCVDSIMHRRLTLRPPSALPLLLRL